MLSRLIQQLFASIGVVFRTLRAFFIRSLGGTVSRVKSATSLTRQAAKLAPAMMKAATVAGKKPTKREDYIETKQLFISKSLIIMTLIVVISFGALFYLVGWPWLVSHFFTAKFWQDDPDTVGYTGKVILYYEEEKENIRFEGRLEEGLIQGAGKYFDENGLLIYDGDYVDGLYSGKGEFYTDGALTYRGEFLEGLYEGKGTLYGASESLIYEGTFVAGLYEGEGILYGPFEKMIYEGGFAAGLRTGEGVAYKNGAKRYKGTFENDLYNGEGVLYDDAGKLLYSGSFVDGLYEGSGILTLDDGFTIKGEFQAGEVLGDAQGFFEGKLYYEGGFVDLLPDGAGTVYGSDGKALYVGPMKNGSIDGGALLGMPAEEIRAMLGEKTKETVYEKGFDITSSALGLTVFCSFAQEDADPSVYFVYKYEPADKIPALLWDSAADFEAAIKEDEDAPAIGERDVKLFMLPIELPVELAGDAIVRPYAYEGVTFLLWSMEKDSEAVLAEWCLNDVMPEPTKTPTASEGSAGRLDALLAQLGLTDKSAGSGDTAAATKNPYYGKTKVTELLGSVDQEDRTAVVKAALTYFESAERRVAAEENLALCNDLLEDARAQLDTGTGDPQLVAQLEDMAARLDVEIMKHVVQMRKDTRTVKDSAGLELDKFDLQGLPMLFDVVSLSPKALGEEAVELAIEAAMAEAEPPVEGPVEPESPEATEGAADAELTEEKPDTPVVAPVDRQAILQEVEDRLMELELAYQDVKLAQREYETASEALAELEQQSAMGTIDKATRIQSQMSANDLRASFYAALSGFATRAADLNELTGGLMAKEAGWLPKVLGN